VRSRTLEAAQCGPRLIVRGASSARQIAGHSGPYQAFFLWLLHKSTTVPTHSHEIYRPSRELNLENSFKDGEYKTFILFSTFLIFPYQYGASNEGVRLPGHWRGQWRSGLRSQSKWCAWCKDNCYREQKIRGNLCQCRVRRNEPLLDIGSFY
jgi:hypothetical protein